MDEIEENVDDVSSRVDWAIENYLKGAAMPSTVNLQLIGVWFCVGFFTGAGWAIAAWIVGRVLRF